MKYKKAHTGTFIRFGGLSMMPQKERYSTEYESFHAPPCRRGVYAFPDGAIEMFLLGATDSPRNLSNKTQWLKDEDGNKIKYSDFYNEDGKYDDNTWRYPVNPKYKKLLKKLNIKEKYLRTTWLDNNDPNDVKEIDHFVTVLKKPRKFNYTGELWCHLGHQLRPEHILEEKGSWVKVTMEDFLYALKMEKRSLKKNIFSADMGFDFHKYKDIDPLKIYSKDHLEVFLEKIN